MDHRLIFLNVGSKVLTCRSAASRQRLRVIGVLCPGYRGGVVHLLNKPLFHIAAIIFLVLTVYSNTLDAPFHFDDANNIVYNPWIKDLRNFIDPDIINRHFQTRYIGSLTFALNYSLHGFDVKGYHLVNILIHLLNALLLYWLVKLVFSTPFFSAPGGGPAFSDGSRSFIAFLSALFFAVHPLQTQAVTYIVQRFTSLATLFYLLSLLLYIKWRESKERRTGWSAAGILLYAGSFLSAVLAVKTKEIAFTLPVVLVLCEALFFGGKVAKRALFLAPFFLVILLIPLSLAGADGSLAFMNGISMNEQAVNLSGDRSSIARGDYLFTQFRVIVTYIRLLVLPAGQNVDHDPPVFTSFFDPEVLLSFLFLASIVLAGAYLFRLSGRPERKDRSWLRLVSFGIFWFFITLAPESSVVPILDVMFEHRVYLPSIGFFTACAAAIGAGRERWGGRAAYAEKAIVSAVLAAALALSGAAYARNEVWRDDVSLWRNAAEGSPNKARVRANLGVAYAKEGRTGEAIREFETALELAPHLVETHYDLGVAYTAQGRIDEAVKEYQEAIRLLPGHARAHNNLALAYIDLGRTDDAVREFQTLLRISPNEYPLAQKFIELLQKKK